MKVNLGCGYKRFKDFINVDSDINCNPDIICNLECDPLPFEDSSVSHIIAHHILEHMGEGYFHLLKEIYRVTKPGGLIDIRVPHHNHEVFLNDPTHRRPITVEGMRLFSKKFNRMTIKSGGVASTLGLIFDVDFEIVTFDYTYDDYYSEIIKSNTPDENERLFREAINTTIETYILLTVIKE